MASEPLFLVVILVLVGAAVGAVLAKMNWETLKGIIVERLSDNPGTGQGKPNRAVHHHPENHSTLLTEEEKCQAELERLKALIEGRKQIALDSDISHHLWDFYYTYFWQATNTQSVDRFVQYGEWYDVKILQAGQVNGLNKVEFELKGDRYRFVDDEETQGWRENIKFFSLFLYDSSDRCLIEIPMKLRVDRWGRNYSVQLSGPSAFLPGDWLSDFISVKLKHQSLRNQEIREQKHQERLWEIEDLKDRFGISD